METIETSESRAGFAFLLVFVLLSAGIVAAGSQRTVRRAKS